MPRSKKALTLSIVAVVALAALAGFAGYLAGRASERGRTTQSTMRFTSASPAEPLTQDFDASEVRNLVLLIGDGMGFGHVLGARAALEGINGRLAMERLPITGWLTTHSAGRLLTDSAAGATALATGSKTEILRVATSAEGRSLKTLAEAAAQRGKAVGMLTDSYLWDATPASFAAHVENRRDHLGIARQMAESDFELFLGGEDSSIPEDDEGGSIEEAFRGRGYRVMRDDGKLHEAGPGPLLGLFDEDAIDSRLAQLTAFALERLASTDQGFLLMVETEETDTGAHLHEFDRMVRGMAELDRAVTAAVDFAQRDRRTLVVVTADHDTGGLALLRGRDGEPLKVHWSTDSHTGNPVPMLAYGPGAENLGGVRDNTEVPRILARLLGLALE